MEAYRQIIAEAKRYKACRLIDDVDSIDALAALFHSAQGVEFLLKTNYPDAEALRKLKEYGLKKYDVYLDEGDIELHNKELSVIADGTKARIVFDGDPATYKVVCLTGSNVTIEASGWAIVRVISQIGANVIISESEHALINTK